MLAHRPAAARGRTRISWLDSAHTFSFGGYHDPSAMGFSVLRVINDDRVAASGGFAPHGHRDMEIVSYVIEGSLEHRDSLGNGSVIRPGDVQRMSAGTGIRHSEYNPSPDEAVRFLQIWILPEQSGLAPGYEQRQFPVADRQGRLRLVADRHGSDGAITIRQDVRIYAGLLAEGESDTVALAPGRRAWVQVVRGEVTANGVALGEGDGLSAQEERSLTIAGAADAEVLVFDLP